MRDVGCSGTDQEVRLQVRAFRRHVAQRAMLLATISIACATPLVAQQATDAARAAECPSCAEWNTPHAPFRIWGDAYFVGTNGLSAVLVTSPAGHVLLDGGLPESAPLIAANIKALGFRVEDVKLILNSHAHYDHAGGIAALQKMSGATVAASPKSAPVIRTGVTGKDDPQYGIALAYPGAGRVRVIADGDTLRVGPLAIVAHFTPGHTPGGTTWSWRSCENGRCVDLVYADSQTPVSADNFRFTRNTTYPTVISDFERSHGAIEGLRCDILVTPHPGASNLWERLAAREAGKADALIDPEACRRYAGNARRALANRVAAEKEKP